MYFCLKLVVWPLYGKIKKKQKMKTTVQFNTSRINKTKEPSCFWQAPKTEIINTVKNYLNQNRVEQDITTSRLIRCLLDDDTVRLNNLRKRILKYEYWLSQIRIGLEIHQKDLLLSLLGLFKDQYKFIYLLKRRAGFSELSSMPGDSTIFDRHLYVLVTNQEQSTSIKRFLDTHFFRTGSTFIPLDQNIAIFKNDIRQVFPIAQHPRTWHQLFPPVIQPKDKQGFHIVLTTHNSRTSKRMIRYRVKKGPPLLFSLTQEIELTRIMGEIIREYGFSCLSYNVCRDHVHLILVCERSELSYLVKIIKGKSSYLFRRGFNGFKPVEDRGDPGGRKHVWSQKFFRANLDIWVPGPTCQDPGYLHNDDYLQNAMRYILYNRVKHQLPQSTELEELITGFTCTPDQAFRREYKGGFDFFFQEGE